MLCLVSLKLALHGESPLTPCTPKIEPSSVLGHVIPQSLITRESLRTFLAREASSSTSICFEIFHSERSTARFSFLLHEPSIDITAVIEHIL